MPRKIDPTTLAQLIIRRTLHSAAGQFKVCSSEFTATWFDPVTNKKVDFTGTIDRQISLTTAQIQGSTVVHELKNVFSDVELQGFNYLLSVEQLGRARLRRAA